MWFVKDLDRVCYIHKNFEARNICCIMYLFEVNCGTLEGITINHDIQSRELCINCDTLSTNAMLQTLLVRLIACCLTVSHLYLLAHELRKLFQGFLFEHEFRKLYHGFHPYFNLCSTDSLLFSVCYYHIWCKFLVGYVWSFFYKSVAQLLGKSLKQCFG